MSDNLSETVWCRRCGVENPKESALFVCIQCGADLMLDTPSGDKAEGLVAPVLHMAIRSEQILDSNVGIAWLAAAVIGAFLISILRDEQNRAVRLLAPCIVMVSYFWWAWRQPSRNQEKLADSLYFLGFIWTHSCPN